MTFAIVASNTYVVNNLTGSSPLEWSELLPTSIVVNEGGWFADGQLQLQLQTFLSVTTNPSNIKRNTERFLNPTQSQIGHVAWLSENFVMADERIKYERQAHTHVAPTMHLVNTRNDARLEIGLTTRSRSGHAQSSASIPVCGIIRGLTALAPAPTQLDLSGTIGLGAVCLTTSLGETEFVQRDVFDNSVQKQLIIDTRSLLIPTEITGVLWTGYELEVGWIIGYHEAASTARVQPPAPYVLGDVTPAIYNYTCDLGLSVPNPMFCTEPNLPFLQYRPNGTAFYSCEPQPN